MRLRNILALAGSATLLAACGGEAASNHAPGSEHNPLVGKRTQLTSDGRSNEVSAKADGASSGAAQVPIGASSDLIDQSAPCKLVSEAQARSILGAPIASPREAPQGPTCIYRTKTGKGFVTLAVQPVDIGALSRKIRKPQRVAVAGHGAYCGTYGQPMLYAGIARGWVLSVGAPCSVAKAFAAKALEQLGG